MNGISKFVNLLILFSLIFCGNAVLPGQEFIKAPGQTYYLDLDTKEGEFSQWRHDDLSTLTALHATVWIPAVRKDPKWLPAFTILLFGGDKTLYGDAGVRVVTPSRNSPLVIDVIQTLPDGSTSELYRVDKVLQLGEKIDVDMDWSTPGTVSIKIGASSYSVKIPSQIEHVRISASTGQMKVDPLVFGNIKQQPGE